MSDKSKEFIITLQITQTHDMQISADNREVAKKKALEEYNQGLVQESSVGVDEWAEVLEASDD
jgi:hypothetical protein